MSVQIAVAKKYAPCLTLIYSLFEGPGSKVQSRFGLLETESLNGCMWNL